MVGILMGAATVVGAEGDLLRILLVRNFDICNKLQRPRSAGGAPGLAVRPFASQ
jgi:hypothetical protein